MSVSGAISSASAQITTLTASNIAITNNLSIAGTLTTVNMTTTNLIDINVSAGSANITNATIATARITSNLLALGNSNTLGNLFTTGGNVLIGATSNTVGASLLIGGQTGVYPISILLQPSTSSTGSKRTTIQIDNWQLLSDVSGNGIKDFGIFDYNGNAFRFIISTIGNVGIGTATPAYTLDVSGTTRFTTPNNNAYLFQCSSTSNNAMLVIQNAASQTAYIGVRGSGLNDLIVQSPTSLVLYSNNGANAITYTSSGNLGIGTASPAATLDVSGTMRISNNGTNLFITPGSAPGTSNSNYCTYDLPGTQTHYFWDNLQATGTITGASKNFNIPHPLDNENKRLIHSSIEGPRYDLIYSGIVQLVNGLAVVNIDTSSSEYPMTEGTFEALCRNHRIFLQNNETFDRVKGSITGGNLIIECESSSSSASINWMVVAERKDANIINSKYTDNQGYLIPERNADDVSIPESARQN